MELNRNQYFMIGLVLLFLGLQFRWVDTYVLNEPTSKFLVERWKKQTLENENAPPQQTLLAATPVTPRQKIRPPQWLGWSLVSIGSVLVLHSFAMKKPGG